MTFLSADLMNVTESQLENYWSNRGAISEAQNTHESIRTALDRHDWPIQFDYDVYLQGSYRNHTNIYGDSDVDVVVELTSIWRRSLSGLTDRQKQAYHEKYSPASKSLDDFHQHVLEALRAQYSSGPFEPDRVEQGDKCIKVDTGYLDTDVVVCQTYRNYVESEGTDPDKFYFHPGITFQTQSGKRIVNYPKVHYKRGTRKHQNTSERFKPMVRCFKNARSHLVEKGEIPEDLAPSYFIECLVHNTPDRCFKSSYRDSFEAIIDHHQGSNLSGMRTQDGILPMFGSDETQWSLRKASLTLKAWKKLLN
jgi:hypothetical protein